MEATATRSTPAHLSLPSTRVVSAPAQRHHPASASEEAPIGEEQEPDAFSIWSRRQYEQLMEPVSRILSTSTHVALAERTNLSRNAVRSTLEGSTWPQLQTVLRLAYVAGVECFTMAAQDLVQHGPPLPASEQALLAAYRRLGAQDRAAWLRTMVDAATRPAA
ncbi:MAG: hypothetical protein ACLFS9_03315 [Nitriliruptoraceae bacterium]